MNDIIRFQSLDILSITQSFLNDNIRDPFDVLNNIYDHRRQVENYTIKADNLEKRLAEIEIRRNSLAQAYNKQFQSMEESVTGFKSTGNFLTGMVDAWNEK